MPFFTLLSSKSFPPVLLSCLLLWVVFRHPAAARDWPQWRGPFFNGSTDETGLPAAWDPARDVKWTADLPGEAGSTPIVCGDRIFLTSTDRTTRNLFAMCFSRTDGSQRWRKAIPCQGRHAPYNREASPSPVTDGQRVIFLFGQGTLLALDPEGNLLWIRHLEEDLGRLSVSFLYSASPLLYRDRLYLAVLRNESIEDARTGQPVIKGLESCLVCIDPASGKILWQQTRPTDAYGVECRDSYATPCPWEAPGGGISIVTVGGNFLTGHDWRDGRELWRLRYSQPGGYRQRVVPTPVEAGGLLLVSKPRRGTIYAVRPGGTGELTTASLAWQYDEPTTTDTPSLLLYRGRVYCVQEQKKQLTCLDPATGRKLWTGDLGGNALFFASPTGADGKIYCVNLASEVVVAEAGEQFKLLGRVKLEGNPTYSTVVAAQGNLFIRTEKKLYCIGR